MGYGKDPKRKEDSLPMKKYVLSFCSIALAIGLLVGCSSPNTSPEATPPANNKQTNEAAKDTTPEHPAPKGKYTAYPEMTIDTNKSYTAKIATSAGDIDIELFAKDAPKAVNSFVFLAKDHFYDGLTFHRVVKDFMIQTGDPQGTGVGGPGYSFEDELNNGHAYEPGVVAMANSGKNTNGSQFFIGSGEDVRNLKNVPKFTIFGKVTKGMDVVEKIAASPVEANSLTGDKDKPVTPQTIKTITIEEK